MRVCVCVHVPLAEDKAAAAGQKLWQQWREHRPQLSCSSIILLPHRWPEAADSADAEEAADAEYDADAGASSWQQRNTWVNMEEQKDDRTKAETTPPEPAVQPDRNLVLCPGDEDEDDVEACTRSS